MKLMQHWAETRREGWPPPYVVDASFRYQDESKQRVWDRNHPPVSK